MPAILIEGGYMTHPVESKKIYDAVYRRQMAQAIVIGILTYQKSVLSPPPMLRQQSSGGKKSTAAGELQEQGFDGETCAVKTESLISKP